MKLDVRAYQWFWYPLSFPPQQRYILLLVFLLAAVASWWSWIYSPLRQHRCMLRQHESAQVHEDQIVHNRLLSLRKSLDEKISCKDLSTIGLLSRVTFDEIRFINAQELQLSFHGTYQSLMQCLKSLEERCPSMQILKLSMESQGQSRKAIVRAKLSSIEQEL